MMKAPNVRYPLSRAAFRAGKCTPNPGRINPRSTEVPDRRSSHLEQSRISRAYRLGRWRVGCVIRSVRRPSSFYGGSVSPESEVHHIQDQVVLAHGSATWKEASCLVISASG